MIAEHDRIKPLHLELLKGVSQLSSEEQVREVRQLLNLYFRGKLDAALEQAEDSRGYVASVYEKWLAESGK